MEQLREAVWSIRKDRNMSRRELAKVAGLNPHSIWKLEIGRTACPTIKTLKSLEIALGVESGFFIGLATYQRKDQEA